MGSEQIEITQTPFLHFTSVSPRCNMTTDHGASAPTSSEKVTHTSQPVSSPGATPSNFSRGDLRITISGRGPQPLPLHRTSAQLSTRTIFETASLPRTASTPLLSSSDPSSSERPGQSASVHLERLENTALGHLPSHSLTSNPPTQQSQSNTRPQQALYLQREPSRGAESLLNFLGKLPFANKRAANPTCIQFRQRGSATPSCSSLSTCDYAPCASNPPEPHESERGGESATIGELEVIDTLSTITQRVSISEGTRGTVEDTSAQGLYAGSQPTSTFTLSKFHFPQPPRGAGIRPGQYESVKGCCIGSKLVCRSFLRRANASSNTSRTFPIRKPAKTVFHFHDRERRDWFSRIRQLF